MRAEKEMGGCRCRRRWRWEKRPRAYRSGGDKGPSTPVVLALFFYIYIMCGEANRDKLPKDGGSPGVGSLDGPFSFRSGSIQLAISFIALYYYTTSYVFLHHRSLCRQQPCPLRPGLPIHDPSFYHSLAAWQPMMARTKRAY